MSKQDKSAILKSLPKDFQARDLEWPSYSATDHLEQTLSMYKTERFGWCINVLHIRNAGRRSLHRETARFYAITLDGQIVTVGLGPHVTAQATIYVRTSRKAALKKYLDLAVKGEGDALSIRDRISTRRAQGQLHRAAGHSYWRW